MTPDANALDVGKPKPRLLDLFCGAGGAARGYADAGFEVVGVDHRPQPRYPFEFHQADALTFPLDGFDAIHASPPCQAYSVASECQRRIGKEYPDLVAATRLRLRSAGVPFVIENVEGAPLFMPAMLCGSMFGLGTSEMWLRRHRYFEGSFAILAPKCRHPKGRLSIGVYGNGTPQWHRKKLGRNVLADEWREAMGAPWMVKAELSQAIPPAYTCFIGRQLMHVVLSKIGVTP